MSLAIVLAVVLSAGIANAATATDQSAPTAGILVVADPTAQDAAGRVRDEIHSAGFRIADRTASGSDVAVRVILTVNGDQLTASVVINGVFDKARGWKTAVQPRRTQRTANHDDPGIRLIALWITEQLIVAQLPVRHSIQRPDEHHQSESRPGPPALSALAPQSKPLPFGAPGRDRSLGFRVSGSAMSLAEGPGSVGIELAADLPLSARCSLDLSGESGLNPIAVSGPGGDINYRVSVFRLAGLVRLFSSEGFSLLAGVGGGVVRVGATARAETGYLARAESRWSSIVAGTLRARISLAGALSLVPAIETGLSLPEIQIEAPGRSRTRPLAPSLSVRLGLRWAL